MTGSTVPTEVDRFAGGAALALAVVTALAGLAYWLLPAEQRLGVPGRELLPSFAANPTPLQVEMALLALMGVIGLAIVRPIRRLLDADNPWLRWASYLAIVGYAVGAVGNTLVMGKLPGIANAFVAADDTSKAVIAVFWRTTLDPWGLWQFGAVGLWLLVVGIVGMRAGGLPRIGAWLAIAAGIAHIAIPVVLGASLQPTVRVLALVGAIVMVVWFAWVGLYLWRRADGARPA